LHFARAAQCIHDAAELDEQTVADGLDDSPAMPGDPGIDHFAPIRLQPRESAFIIGAMSRL
jgi:hypothetical protein